MLPREGGEGVAGGSTFDVGVHQVETMPMRLCAN